MASSSWATTSSVSLSQPSYDVFINFRGPDTRTNFVSLLYKALIKDGVHAYRDSDELWEGEEIRPSLLRAIQGSSISIPVFSKNYAESKYCLLELAKMWECHLFEGQMILPVFINVEPRDVRHQTGSFEGPFQDHQKKYDYEDVKSWKNALKEVGNIKGWTLKGDATIEDQSNLVELIVQRVLRESSSSPMGECKYSIGIDSHINKLLSLLKIDSKGVRFVAICGMGGLGKTTIAKAVYNCIFKSFNGSSFLTDVREEASQGDKGLVSLQNRLLKDILKREHDVRIVSQGSELIKRLLHGKKILLILDDVDDHVQLDVLVGGISWFGQGSRVIITTRDDQSLNAHKVDKDIQIYKPKGLNFENSLQLLSLYAFSKNEPPEMYKQLSYKIVQYAEGLPLTLEVLGSFLFGKEKEEWEDTIEGLKDILDNSISGISIKIYDEKVLAKLMISYNKLSDHAKIIFLDIACHFIGWRVENIIPRWEACVLHPRLAIRELTQKHLIEIGDHMHDQLRFMGRRIVSQVSNGDPAKCTRLWSHDDILKVLEKGTETQMVEVILLLFKVQTDALRFEDFAKMPNLRFLQVNSDYSKNLSNNLNGDFSHLPSKLRWFCWWYCPLKILPANFYHEDLVHLDLSRSGINIAWSDKPQNKNNRFRKLKVLILRGCSHLSKSPDFFSWFPCLQRLDLTECFSLLELPDSICQMTSLKTLILKSCFEIKKLPTSIGNLKHLVELSVSGTAIEELPNGVWQLEKLEKLNVSYCNKLVRLPTSMGRMRSLLYFDMSDTMIIKLPDDFSKLISSLEVLRMGMAEQHDQRDHKRLQPLLISMCDFSQLQVLYLSGYMNLESLPKLPSTLTHLEVNNCILLQMISDLSHLERLEELLLRYCNSLVRLPDFSNLKRLKKLLLDDCKSLVRLPDLPNQTKLKELLFDDCKSLARLPDLSNLKRLKKLRIRNCENLEEVQGLEGTDSLEELRVKDCHKLRKLPNLSNLKRVRELSIHGCENLEEIHGLEGTESLGYFSVLGCYKLMELPGLSNLKKLRDININNCENLEEIRGLEGIESLGCFSVVGCNKIMKLPDLSNLKRLRDLQIRDCKNLEKIPILEGIESLEKLVVKGCHKLTLLSDMSNLKRLRRTEICDCINLEKIHVLKGIESLEELEVEGCHKLIELPDLSHLKMLRELEISNCENLEEIHCVEGIESLEILVVEGCHKLTEIPDMSNLKRLSRIFIKDCVNVEKIHHFNRAESLEVLDLQGCSKLTETLRKIHGQGRLVDNVGEANWETFSIVADDHDDYRGAPILCVVFAFTSGRLVKFVAGELVSFTLYIDASIRWRGKRRGKTTSCSHSIRIEDIEFTTKRDTIYVHHFEGFDWVRFPLESKQAIEELNVMASGIYRQSDSRYYNSYDQISAHVKLCKVLFENKDSEQTMPNKQSSAILVADFFKWSDGNHDDEEVQEEEGADEEVEELEDADNDEEVEEEESGLRATSNYVEVCLDDKDKRAAAPELCNCFAAVKAIWDSFYNFFGTGFL